MVDEKKKHSKKPSHEDAETSGTQESETFKGIVRIAGKDIRGQVKLRQALTYVRGIGTNLSYPISKLLHSELNIGPDTRVGDLSEGQIENIDKVLFSIGDYATKVPQFLFNRRADFVDGSNKHAIMNDLIFAVKQDIEREKKAYSWKGYRHSYGQKVRGQRTRNTGRTGMAVGVLRKTIMAAAGAAKEGQAGAKVAGPAGPVPAKAAEKPAGGPAAKPTGAKPAK
ncbi:30S ribosomal protein S13 [Candidatus Micrarchaeota archaeon]|nr:30S ribosomal protein S13 [Candidatus Micrarchaeota archaeon]